MVPLEFLSYSLSKHHGSVGVFVIQLEKLDVVMISSLTVWSLHCSLAHRYYIVELGELLTFLVCLSEAHTDLLGGVEAHGVHDVAKVEEVELALAVPVIDVADLLASFGVNHDLAGLSVCW